MKNPPSGVKLVMAAVCVMKDIKPDKIPDPNKPGVKVGPHVGQAVCLNFHLIVHILNLDIGWEREEAVTTTTHHKNHKEDLVTKIAPYFFRSLTIGVRQRSC